MDCRLTTRDGESAVEWTWDGNDEMDPAQGRGWAVVKRDELHGMIFFPSGRRLGIRGEDEIQAVMKEVCE